VAPPLPSYRHAFRLNYATSPPRDALPAPRPADVTLRWAKEAPSTVIIPSGEVGSSAGNSQESKGGSFIDGAKRFVEKMRIEILDARSPGAAPLGVSNSVVSHSVSTSVSTTPRVEYGTYYWETKATVSPKRIR